MPNRDELDAARLMARHAVMAETQAYEFTFHRALEQYLLEMARLSRTNELVFPIDTRRYNPHWGRPMTVVLRRLSSQKWGIRMEMNTLDPAPVRAALLRKPAEKGILSREALWTDAHWAGITKMAFFPEGDFGWWRYKTGPIALALAVRMYKDSLEYSADSKVRIQTQWGPKGQDWPNLPKLRPDLERDGRKELTDRVLSKSEQLATEFREALVPEIVPWSVFRNRGRMTTTQALARHLCVEKGLSYKAAARAMGADPGDIPKFLKGSEKNLHASGQKSGELGRSKHTMPRRGKGGEHTKMASKESGGRGQGNGGGWPSGTPGAKSGGGRSNAPSK